jgi:hypothetical protein
MHHPRRTAAGAGPGNFFALTVVLVGLSVAAAAQFASRSPS